MSKKTIKSFSEEVLNLMPHIFKGVLHQSDALASGRITIPQFLTLNLISAKEPVKMKEVAESLDITLPGATGIVQRLFKMGMVKRVYDEADRRIIKIVLTSKGKNIVEEVKTKRKELIESIFGELTEEERQNYLHILRKLKDIIALRQESPAE